LLLEQEPIEQNKVVLDDKKDKFEIPKVKLFYKETPQLLKTAKFFLEEFANLCLENDLGRIAIKDGIFNLEKLEPVGSGGHHMGGTRMGTDKYKSVVNTDLKIHDIDNLYVSGSSNFFTGGYTNPTFTIIQFAIRLAEKLNERLRSA
jgi:choline dehydrogenase-like flavoprotein